MTQAFTPELMEQVEHYIVHGPPEARLMMSAMISQIQSLSMQLTKLEDAIVELQATSIKSASEGAAAIDTIKRVWLFLDMLEALAKEHPSWSEMLLVIARELKSCLLDIDLPAVSLLPGLKAGVSATARALDD